MENLHVAEYSTAELVDKGYKLKCRVDAAEEELDAIKVEIKQRAKKEKCDHYIGNKHFVNISPTSSTDCDSKEMYETYKDMGREKDFFPLVKPLVGQVKKDLGETLFATISTVKTFSYNKIAFRGAVPKKYLKKG